MCVYLHGSLTKKRDGYFHVKLRTNVMAWDSWRFQEISKLQTRKDLPQKVECYPGPNQVFILLFYETISKGKEKHRVSSQSNPFLCPWTPHCPVRKLLLLQGNSTTVGFSPLWFWEESQCLEFSFLSVLKDFQSDITLEMKVNNIKLKTNLKWRKLVQAIHFLLKLKEHMKAFLYRISTEKKHAEGFPSCSN